MINRDNWLDTKKFLDYLQRIKQLDPKTIHRRREQLRHLLEWAQEKSFANVRTIDQTFPQFLLTSRYDGKKTAPSAGTMKETCDVVRYFFEWARREMPRKYPRITVSWIDTIRPSRAHGVQTEIKQHRYYSFEDMIKISRVQVTSLMEERSQAAMCLLFLTMARADAFVTLPISAVHLESMKVFQLPSMKVRTKNHKAAITSMYPINELLQVAQSWDDKVRSLLPNESMWFANIDRMGENLLPCYNPPESRTNLLRDGAELICKLAGVEYKGVHAARHAGAMYGLSRAKTHREVKAVSENMMHESMQTTDQIYGKLLNEDVHSVITSMRPDEGTRIDLEGLGELLKVIEEHPDLLDALKKKQ